MPKVIENLREKLLAEAKKQIIEHGYACTTVRSVADACGVGVGTVYNYFQSKDMLIAGFVSEDWKAQLSTISSLPSDEPEALLRGIFESLKDFARNNKELFSDADAAKVISIGFASRHKKLRDILAEFILPACRDAGFADSRFASEFISEAIISWAMEDADFDTVYGVIGNLFIK